MYIQKRLGVISDTHGMVSENAWRVLAQGYAPGDVLERKWFAFDEDGRLVPADVATAVAAASATTTITTATTANAASTTATTSAASATAATTATTSAASATTITTATTNATTTENAFSTDLSVNMQGAVDAIVHAGDICGALIIDELETIAPVYAVLGNCDREQIMSKRGWVRLNENVTFAGVDMYVTHTPTDLFAATRGMGEFRKPKVVSVPPLCIHGHTHQARIEWDEACKSITLNPGSVTRPRGGNKASLAVVHFFETVEAADPAYLANQTGAMNEMRAACQRAVVGHAKQTVPSYMAIDIVCTA